MSSTPITVEELVERATPHPAGPIRVRGRLLATLAGAWMVQDDRNGPRLHLGGGAGLVATMRAQGVEEYLGGHIYDDPAEALGTVVHDNGRTVLVPLVIEVFRDGATMRADLTGRS
ncbi:MAG: hypothetical protein AVDCRST_MAG66-2986 [uncultured Pseudonocardia sp.]|uniref:Uncharacterized protein n=1 Tax=uncultured Pseudonocardia sp. TaxID=211455 RepID=A0A6J4PV58_9PSEU|nr:MAG: hypothetical protein AVDCRST_MAG66-2986 [uncultured Pseudonocardia sp.]